MTLESPCEGFLAPSERRRTYAAALAQQGPDLTLTVSGADIVITNGQGNTFSGSLGVTDDVAFGFGSFTVAYYYYYYFGGVTSATGLVERLSATTALVFSGSVNARATGSSISGRLPRHIWSPGERPHYIPVYSGSPVRDAASLMRSCR